MSACTLYIQHQDPKTCVMEIQRRAIDLPFEINLLVYEARGDRFSRLRLSTCNYVRTKTNGREKQSVLDHIQKTGVIAGVPEGIIDISGTLDPSLADIAADLDAIIFDGLTFRDASWRDLLT